MWKEAEEFPQPLPREAWILCKEKLKGIKLNQIHKDTFRHDGTEQYKKKKKEKNKDEQLDR